MRHRFILIGAVLATSIPLFAQAAIWNWGCQGQLGGQLVVFNRDRIYVVDGKMAPGNVRNAIENKMAELTKGKDAGYLDQNGNEGFDVDTREFARNEDTSKKIAMTETSSRRTSHHTRLVCGRDETIDTFRKAFRFQREDEPARTITMQCFEYTLSTRGGRKGCD
jgi:hypothetical protein